MRQIVNPSSFSEPPRFKWYASSEGRDWQAGLQRALLHQELTTWQTALIRAAVRETLRRIGIDRFRRHYEIRNVLLHRELRLIEIKWRFSNSIGPMYLRLYSALRDQGVLVVGLCFREKLIRANSHDTRAMQNQDIDHAAVLARSYDAHENK